MAATGQDAQWVLRWDKQRVSVLGLGAFLPLNVLREMSSQDQHGFDVRYPLFSGTAKPRTEGRGSA